MKAFFIFALIVTAACFDYQDNLSYQDAPMGYTETCQGCQGKIVRESYNGINGQNNCLVYLPVGYDDSKPHNIFYLMHGGGENEGTIFGNDVNLQNILDHLIKDGKIEPMIVVTPTFNKCEAGTFYKELRESLIPFIEGKYKTYAKSTSADDIKASRFHRCFGGFSMGGVATWATFQNDLDIVGYFMPLSGDHWQGGSPDEKANNLVNAIKQNGFTDRDFFIFCATGSDDIAYPNVSPQIEAMKKHSEFVYTSNFSKGNLYFLVAQGKTHWWGYVKHYVCQGLPYLFHEGS